MQPWHHELTRATQEGSRPWRTIGDEHIASKAGALQEAHGPLDRERVRVDERGRRLQSP